MSLSERAKSKQPRFADLETWLETLPKTEHEGAVHMLSSPSKWSVQDILDEFREDALTERGEVLAFGEKQVYRWRKVNGVTR